MSTSASQFSERRLKPLESTELNLLIGHYSHRGE